MKLGFRPQEGENTADFERGDRVASGQENLIPASRRSREEASANGRKGGKASGEARRRKKALRAILKAAVPMQLKDLPDDMRAAIMTAAGLTDDSLTVADALLGSLIRTACMGNPQMMKLILDVLGETPDVRMKERELKLKERAGEIDTPPGGITFHWERSPMMQLVQSLEDARENRQETTKEADA